MYVSYLLAMVVLGGRVYVGSYDGGFYAFDAATGDQKWRWFTVPGEPSKPFEDDSMATAAKTTMSGSTGVKGKAGSTGSGIPNVLARTSRENALAVAR